MQLVEFSVKLRDGYHVFYVLVLMGAELLNDEDDIPNEEVVDSDVAATLVNGGGKVGKDG